MYAILVAVAEIAVGVLVVAVKIFGFYYLNEVQMLTKFSKQALYFLTSLF